MEKALSVKNDFEIFRANQNKIYIEWIKVNLVKYLVLNSWITEVAEIHEVQSAVLTRAAVCTRILQSSLTTAY